MRKPSALRALGLLAAAAAGFCVVVLRGSGAESSGLSAEGLRLRSQGPVELGASSADAKEAEDIGRWGWYQEKFPYRINKVAKKGAGKTPGAPKPLFEPWPLRRTKSTDYKWLKNAKHHTPADLGYWWGDNDAWHDGWAQRYKDLDRPYKGKSWDGIEQYYKDITRGKSGGMNDDQTYKRTPHHTTFQNEKPEYKNGHKLTYGMTLKPAKYTNSYKELKDTGKNNKLPPWCDHILGCMPPYDKRGNLHWDNQYIRKKGKWNQMSGAATKFFMQKNPQPKFIKGK